jgi:phosphatidylglycerophosphate synthase
MIAAMPADVRRRLPNVLTLFRLGLAAAFFAILEFRLQGRTHWMCAYAAVAIFILAALTDAFDGWLARRWGATTTFGRIMDPICDKVLVIGAFIYLAGPRFLTLAPDADGQDLTSATGVYPWMVVVILFRELLVTGIRSVAESRGVAFPSMASGKWKMVLQAAAVPVVLAIASTEALLNEPWVVYARDGLLYVTVLVTGLSAAPYVTHFQRAMRARGGPDNQAM